MAAVLSELLYFKHTQQGWSHQEKKKILFWLWPCSAKEGEKKVLFFLLGLNHTGTLSSIYFTISLRFSPRAGRAETPWEMLLHRQLARGQGRQISLRKDGSQGAHNYEVFQLPCCKSFALPTTTAVATGAQPCELHRHGRDGGRTGSRTNRQPLSLLTARYYWLFVQLSVLGDGGWSLVQALEA